MTFKFKVIVNITSSELTIATTNPSIAQLVERWTVVVMHQKSIGRWFKSGSKEFFHVTFVHMSSVPALGRMYVHQFLDSLVVRISACYVEGPGSIPG